MAAFTVSLHDPGNLAGSNISGIRASVEAAAGRWFGLIQGFGTVDIQVNVERLGTGSSALATGGSAASAYVGLRDGKVVYQQSAAWELQTGIDVNGGGADLIITLNVDHIADFFFDPTSSQPIPPNKFDAVTIFLHEISHGLAFNTFRNEDGGFPTFTWTDGQRRNYQFVYDTFVSINGDVARFNGPNSNLVSGGLLLAGVSNTAHAGTADLLNPFAPLGERRSVSEIDVAVAQDIGLPIATERSDYIVLLFGNDVFLAGGGDDTIDGGLGDDSIVGGSGRDLIVGGEGRDVILSNQQDDIILGNQGDDIVVGGQGLDIVVGGQGNDFVFGNESDDIVFGNEGNDTIFAGQGHDTVFAGQGNDTVWGNEGNDMIYGNEGADRFVLGPGSGFDTIRGFSALEGDVLDLQGQTATEQTVSGGVLMTLSGGGTIFIEGVTIA